MYANGATDGDHPGARLSLYDAEEGPADRGVCLNGTEPVHQEEILMRIPLRLGIWDQGAQIHRQCPGLTELGCLALALLEEIALGSASARRPWLQVLPREVHSLYGSFPAALYGELQGAVPAAALTRVQNRAADERTAAAPRIQGSNFPLEHWRWALSVVLSRALAVPGPEGVIVPMLVPMVDMLNHAGDETAMLLSDEARSMDNVRWEVEQSADGEHLVQIVATCDVEDGEEALLSYGRHSNAHLLLHYGFVQNRNPHEAAVLFQTLMEAVDWALEKHPPQTLEQASAGAEAERRDAAAAAAALVGRGEWNVHPDDVHQISMQMLWADQKVDERLVAALTALHGGELTERRRYAMAVPSARCLELLGQPEWTGLEEDLTELMQMCESNGSAETAYYSALLQHYTRVCSWVKLKSDDHLPGSGQRRITYATQETGPIDGQALMAAMQLRVSQKMLLWDFALSGRQSTRMLAKL